jgi:putative flavoprotein involved in K+ transport
MSEQIRVAIIGAGQAGLATSWSLTEHGIEHVLFDRGRTGDSWRHRWDSFCLVTPNWSLDLPGHSYQGEARDGFMARDDIVAFLEEYRASFEPPVRDGVEVSSVHPNGDGWRLDTDAGPWDAANVVVASGPFPKPLIPRAAADLDPEVAHIHSHDYQSPDRLAAGGVLVVGSAQSGCQIVDDLHSAGREVWLAVGGAGRAPRRYRGRDSFEWLADMGLFSTPLEEFPDGPPSRFEANPHVSGRDGGKDLDLRAFGRDGVQLLGRLQTAEGTVMRFADDLHDRLRAADEAARELEEMIDGFIAEAGIEASPDDRTLVTWTPQRVDERVDLAERGIGSVVWATGYHLDFTWIEAPVFGERDYPIQRRGVSEAPGLYFVGLNRLHTFASALFMGVGRDAGFVASEISANGR